MGLDMFLYAYSQEGTKMVLEQVAYWRKAHATHEWFVRNVQNNIDNCTLYYLNREDLVELLSACKEIKNNPDKAYELLPTENDVFHSEYGYNEYYFEKLDDTIEQLEKVLRQEPKQEYFYYDSSW